MNSNGYLGFVEKVREANADETKKLCKERTQMYVDKIQEVIAVTPSADLIFVITALRMITETVQKINPEATHMAQKRGRKPLRKRLPNRISGEGKEMSGD